MEISLFGARGGMLKFKGIIFVSVKLMRGRLLFNLNCQLDWIIKCLGDQWSTLVCEVIPIDKWIKRTLT